MFLPETQSVQCRLDGDVLYLTFNRPDARNAMSAEVLADIVAVFDALKLCSDIRAVVLRGAGGNFCAGGDIKDFSRLRAQPVCDGVDPVARFNRQFGHMLQLVNEARQATVAVIEGAVLGGGFGLACVADVAIASKDATFGMPETGLGIIPAQIAPFVVERIGLSQARRLGVCGARFDSDEAQRLGLVHFVETDTQGLDDRLADVLQMIRRCAPQANAQTKRIMLSMGQRDLNAILDDAAAQFSVALQGAEAAEGTQAFIEKRLPYWAQG